MSLAAALHLLLHVLVPGAAAWALFRARWSRAWLIMLATMAVDLDHLIADPVYDPNRCSIGFHPLHTAPAIGAYALMTALPPTRIVGTGLLIHMALDASDCAVQTTTLAHGNVDACRSGFSPTTTGACRAEARPTGRDPPLTCA